MKLSKILVLLVIASGAAGIRAQSCETHSLPTSLTIPLTGTGGAAGGTSNPANATTVSLNITDSRVVDRVKVGLDVTHTAVGNLRMELSHCGTTVVLYDQSPSSYANLTGVYEFDSVVLTTFASAIQAAPANGAVTAGTYAPVNSLGAFNGTNSAGQWTLKIYDLAQFDVGILLGVTLTICTGQLYNSPAAPGPIPDGLGGNCLSPVTQVINVSDHGPVDEVVAYVNMTHPYISDLDISIQHLGVSVMLSRKGAPSSNADVNGWYLYWDGAQTAWDAAETQYVNSVIPNGTYRPGDALAAFRGLDKFGPWYLTVCDGAGGDVGSMNLPSSIHLTVSPYHFTISQPNGPASVTLTNSGGVQGHIFANFFTLTPGIAPFGWLFGLDITVPDLITQMAFGAPFVGLFDACGNSSFTIPGPIPTGLTVWCVSIHVDANWMPVAIDPVRSYTTSP